MKMNTLSINTESRILREMNQLEHTSTSTPSNTIKISGSITFEDAHKSETEFAGRIEKDSSDNKQKLEGEPNITKTLNEVSKTSISLNEVCERASVKASRYTTIDDHDKPENIPLPEDLDDIVLNEVSTKTNLNHPDDKTEHMIVPGVPFNRDENEYFKEKSENIDGGKESFSAQNNQRMNITTDLAPVVELYNNKNSEVKSDVDKKENVPCDKTFKHPAELGSAYMEVPYPAQIVFHSELDSRSASEESKINISAPIVAFESNLTELEENILKNHAVLCHQDVAIPMEIDVSLTNNASLNKIEDMPKIEDSLLSNQHSLSNTPVPYFPIRSKERRSRAFYGENEHFKSSENFQFSDTDFEFLGNLKSDKVDIDRNSLLLRFDPLLKKPVVSPRRLKITTEETFENTDSTSIKGVSIAAANVIQEIPHTPEKTLDGVKNMSIIILNAMKDKALEDKLNCENIMSEQDPELKMSELEKKARNEVLKLEELEKKLEEESKKRFEMEHREELLLKRIADKDRAFTKLQNVVAEYEKAISEMITEKEQLAKNFDATCKQLKEDSETNAQHLGSLENTFSDLHAKYERTKQVAAELKEREATLGGEKKALEECLRIQEQRYEKMKNHAVSQLENANLQLEEQMKNHQLEITKLRAQLKKEEISRASIQEQLSQKSKENEELVKICDELINGGDTS